MAHLAVLSGSFSITKWATLFHKVRVKDWLAGDFEDKAAALLIVGVKGKVAAKILCMTL